MDRSNFAFGKTNYIICAIAFLAVIIGFLLMTGPATEFPDHAAAGSINGFQPDIFSFRRITVAPMIVFFGFMLMIVGILFPDRKEKTAKEENLNTNKK